MEILKATPPEPARFDRAELFRRFEGVRKIAMLLDLSYPAQVPQVIRKLGIERIVVSPGAAEKGWTFEGVTDIGPLVNKGTSARAEVPFYSIPFKGGVADPGHPVGGGPEGGHAYASEAVQDAPQRSPGGRASIGSKAG